MILEWMIVLGVMGMIGYVGVVKPPSTIEWNRTPLGMAAQTLKFEAMANKQSRSLVIRDAKYDQWRVAFSDCELGISSTGRASQAGTCRGMPYNLSLRPGEGGIGYPWR